MDEALIITEFPEFKKLPLVLSDKPVIIAPPRTKSLSLTCIQSLYHDRMLKSKCLSLPLVRKPSRYLKTAGFGFECEAGSIFRHRKTSRHRSQPSSLSHSTASSTEAIGSVIRSVSVSCNATRIIKSPGWWPRSDWQRRAQTSKRKSL